MELPFEKESAQLSKELEDCQEKVDAVMDILMKLAASGEEEQQEGIKEADIYLGMDMEVPPMEDVDSYLVKYRDDRTVINSDEPSVGKPGWVSPTEVAQFSFMNQFEEDAKKRAENKRQREKIAQNLRELGNDAYRANEYEKAINLYRKAIDHVDNSPVLYTNRAICYIRLELYKHAIIDCDYVIRKIDDKDLRAWLYRATSYYHLDDQPNFKKSISNAKKNNSKEIEFIEKFAAGLETGEYFAKKT